nr:iron-sulfur cluster assembly accessory protein [Betaproteobacteria bacterium]
MPTLTETAASEIKKIMKDQGLPEQTRLRVGVKGGGCSGFSYMLDLTEEPPTESDEELECHGVKMLVDQKSLLYLT